MKRTSSTWPAFAHCFELPFSAIGQLGRDGEGQGAGVGDGGEISSKRFLEPVTKKMLELS